MRVVSLLLVLLLGQTTAVLTAQTRADSLAVESATWEMELLRPGVTLRRTAFAQLYGGAQYVSIVEVAAGRDWRAALAQSDTLAPTSVIAQAHGAVAAINGTYFDTRRGNSVGFLKIGGVVVDTTTAGEFKLRVNGAVRFHQGGLNIVPWDKQTEKNYRGSDDVMASGPLLLQGGRTCDWDTCDSSFIHSRHPRSAVAVAANGAVWLVTVDGRAPGKAIGVTIPQLAHLIRVLGGRDALNLDGGGSTTLWTGGKVANHPSDNRRFDHDGERKVPSIIYFGR